MTLGLSNATYHKIDVLLSVFNCDGISQNHGGLLYDEQKKVLSESLPVRILKDYEYLEWLQQSKWIKNCKFDLHGLVNLEV